VPAGSAVFVTASAAGPWLWFMPAFQLKVPLACVCLTFEPGHTAQLFDETVLAVWLWTFSLSHDTTPIVWVWFHQGEPNAELPVLTMKLVWVCAFSVVLVTVL